MRRTWCEIAWNVTFVLLGSSLAVAILRWI